MVTMLTHTDYAGSGHKIIEALSRWGYDSDIFSRRPSSSFGHPTKNLVTGDNRERIQQRIDESDIIHIKGDWPAVDGYMGFNIMHRNVVQTVGGGFFRKKGIGGGAGLGKFEMKEYRASLKTAFTPDLCYPEYSNIWTPHPIDSGSEKNIWRMPTLPILMHMPSNRSKKDSWFIMKVLNEVKRRIPCIIKIIEKVPFSEAIEMKKEATIFFDQFLVGFYGNSAIEAMQYGIPTACYISNAARNQAGERLDKCPIISERKDIGAWVDMIVKLLESDMGNLSKETKEWCDTHHSYEAIANQWDTLYKTII